MPQKAPISIIPSRPMFTTPERSENIPPIAAKMSGVAKTSIEAIRLAVKTSFRFAELERVARHREAGAEHARGDRAAADPLGAAADGDRRRTAIAEHPDERSARQASAAAIGGIASQKREHARAGRRRMPIDVGSTKPTRRAHRSDVGAHGEAASGSGARSAAAAAPSFRREFQTARMSTSAPTNSTTSPWMICVRLPARLGSIVPDWRPCVVP